MFSSSEERDAWKTVRGYVYRVNLTVERWLELQEREILELERGEDIDRVLPSLLTGDERSRVVEQVKHRDTTLTLRSPDAFSALAYAVEHLAQNKGLDLLFRYITNSSIGTERPSPMEDRTPLIEVWGKLRQGQLDEDQQSRALEAIRETLRNATPPGELNKRVLKRFLLLLRIASDRGLLAFIRHFEWSTGNTEAREMQGSLVQRLLSCGLATDEPQAEEQYHALFVHVLKLLCARPQAADL